MSESFRLLGPAAVASRVARYRGAGAELQAAPGVSVRSAPAWVAELGLAAAEGSYWVWVGISQPPASGTGEPAPRAAGQLVLDGPEGRYLIDVLDATTGATISRESAGGPPLVLGLPFRGVPLVVHIRPVANNS